MPLNRRPLIVAAAALALLGAGSMLVAQMESGDRGILPVDSSGTLEIGGIHVDAGGKSGVEARYAGWRMAQRDGFKALWAKSQGRPLSEAPNLPDSVLDGLVSSVVIEREQIGPNRYIADLGILFDRARAGELLGVGGVASRSAPMLLIPIMTSGGAPTAVELRNPWQRAWASFRTAQSPIDYVRVSGMGIDPLLINAAQVRRPGRGWWRNVMDFYGAANVLVAEVDVHRLYPGGPAIARFTGSFGPDRQLLGSFTMTAKDSADMPRLMAEGVHRMDDMFAAALADGIVRGDPSLITQPPPVEEAILDTPSAANAATTAGASTIQLVLSSPNAGALGSAVAEIRSIAGVTAVSEPGAAAGGKTVLSVTFQGDGAAFAAALRARGFAADSAGNSVRAARGTASAPAANSPSPPPPAPGGGQG